MPPSRVASKAACQLLTLGTLCTSANSYDGVVSNPLVIATTSVCVCTFVCSNSFPRLAVLRIRSVWAGEVIEVYEIKVASLKHFSEGKGYISET